MAGSAMGYLRRPKLLRIFMTAPLLLPAAAGWAASPVEAAAANRARQYTATQSSGAESRLPVFEMHSGFWVNLHHFLYLQARLLKGNSSSTETTRGAAQPDEPPVSLIDFPEADIHAWQDAVGFYTKDLAGRDLLLNGDMEIINNQLSAMETCPDLEGKTTPLCKSGLRQDLVEALERAAPVYRAHWWAQQDRANREWIIQIAPMIQKMGVELSGQLADVYQRPWPSERLRVDVVWYAGPFGAYTTLDPIHVTISSHDPRNRGVYGFEVLFHESSHALAGAVTAAIAREFRERDKPIPRDFWHALLFYTTGEIVRRDVEYGSMTFTHEQTNAPPGYLPYAARFGLYSGSWEHFRGLLDLYWLPYLDGTVSFETAIARMAADM
ncbi:MAG TPA: hypothetical protein VGP19_02895 [Candidatus Acidoferrales bacterium]|nr:hypothetical protein [Candidatus Acidoferrales bacterium]